MAKKNAAADMTEEQKKAAGQTDSQKAMREYHEGKFQTHDPITGEKRDDEPRPAARVDRGEYLDADGNVQK